MGIETRKTRAAGLRILVTNEQPDRLERLMRILAGLGHDAVSGVLAAAAATAASTREVDADIALVTISRGTENPVGLVSKLAREASCPVLVLIEDRNACFVRELAGTPVFGFIVDEDDDLLAGTIDIALRRFAEFHNLQEAFGRRAIIERAKGILMARKGLDERKAFELLRSHSQRTGRKLIEIANAVTNSHDLL